MLLRANLYIAAGAAAWTGSAAHELGCAPGPAALIACVFGATWSIYCLDRRSPWSVEDAPRSPGERRVLEVGIVAGALIALVTACWLPWRLGWLCAPLTLIAVGYALPLLPWRGQRLRLKQLPGAKVFLIAACWALVTAGLPALLHRAAPTAAAWLIVERASFILAITLPFDVRDLDADRRAKIVTLPALLGLPRTRALCLAALALSGLTAALTRDVGWGLVVALGVTGAALAALKDSRPAWYHAGLLDGTILLHAALSAWR